MMIEEMNKVIVCFIAIISIILVIFLNIYFVFKIPIIIGIIYEVNKYLNNKELK